MNTLYAFGKAYLAFWRDRIVPAVFWIFVGMAVEAAAVYLLRTAGFH